MAGRRGAAALSAARLAGPDPAPGAIGARPARPCSPQPAARSCSRAPSPCRSSSAAATRRAAVLRRSQPDRPRRPSSRAPAKARPAAPRQPAIAARQLHSYLSTTTSGAPTPPHFRPTSVTFVGVGGNRVVGAVIGQAGPPCSTPHVCTSLAGTSDYGGSWYGVSAPVVRRAARQRPGSASSGSRTSGTAGPSARRCMRPATAAGRGTRKTPSVSGSSTWKRPRGPAPGRCSAPALAPGRLRRHMHELLAVHLCRGQQDVDTRRRARRVRRR